MMSERKKVRSFGTSLLVWSLVNQRVRASLSASVTVVSSEPKGQGEPSPFSHLKGHCRKLQKDGKKWLTRIEFYKKKQRYKEKASIITDNEML